VGEIFKAEKPRASMAHTGERLSAGHSLETEVEHFHRYYMARHFCRGRRVLDIASGEGYGSALLAQVAADVIGVDVDPAAVAHAAETYARDNLRFRQGSATEIPVDDNSIDVLVSFETLEHFVDHDRFMSEARRILRPGGKLILSTPDRDIFSPVGAPATEYHLHELTKLEFKTLLSRHFAHCAFFAQRVLVGSAILRDEGDPAGTAPLVFERRGEGHIEASLGIPRARYLLCVASDANDDAAPGGLFIDTGNLADPTGRSASLERELEETRGANRAALAAMQREHDALVERIDRDRRVQVAEIDRRHGEDMKSARREAEARASVVEQHIATLTREAEAGHDIGPPRRRSPRDRRRSLARAPVAGAPCRTGGTSRRRNPGDRDPAAACGGAGYDPWLHDMAAAVEGASRRRQVPEGGAHRAHGRQARVLDRDIATCAPRPRPAARARRHRRAGHDRPVRPSLVSGALSRGRVRRGRSGHALFLDRGDGRLQSASPVR